MGFLKHLTRLVSFAGPAFLTLRAGVHNMFFANDLELKYKCEYKYETENMLLLRRIMNWFHFHHHGLPNGFQAASCAAEPQQIEQRRKKKGSRDRHMNKRV